MLQYDYGGLSIVLLLPKRQMQQSISSASSVLLMMRGGGAGLFQLSSSWPKGRGKYPPAAGAAAAPAASPSG